MFSKELVMVRTPSNAEAVNESPRTHEEAVSEGERLIQAGVQYGEYTLIFNRHVTPDDAAESVEDVVPDSLVFLEGFTENGDDVAFHNLVSVLNDIRATWGKSSQEYQDFKQRVIGFCAKGMDLPPKGPSDFWHHKCTQIGLLLDKDCVMRFADYRRFDDADDQEAAERAHDIFLRSKRKDDDPQWWEGLRDNRGIGRVIVRLNAEVANKVRFHTLREIHAVNNTLMHTGYYAENPHSFELATNEEGKVKTYVIYGTAHANSLMQQFVSLGAAPEVRIVKPDVLAEYRYIDPVTTMSEWQKQNGRRRVGHEVVSLLVDSFSDPSNNEDLIAEAYEALAQFNEADSEEWWKFLISALMTARDIDHEDPEAYSKYLSVLRSFMSKPQRFV